MVVVRIASVALWATVAATAVGTALVFVVLVSLPRCVDIGTGYSASVITAGVAAGAGGLVLVMSLAVARVDPEQLVW